MDNEYEPRYEKTGFLYMQKQRCRSAAQLISAFVFAIRIVRGLSEKFVDTLSTTKQEQ